MRIRILLSAFIATLLCLLAGLPTAHAESPPVGRAEIPAPTPNGLVATPPLGWNDWYSFYCEVNEQLILETADAMVSSGMRAAGYEYVNLDDCWSAQERNQDGELVGDPVKFPHGIKWLADQVHARGLKLGIYNDVGTETCAKYPGGYQHYTQDAKTFAGWGIDFVKVDWCNIPYADFPGMTKKEIATKLYGEYAAALANSGRRIVFSICTFEEVLNAWEWAPTLGNMWRTSTDYAANWPSILHNIDRQADLARYAGPGHWNDPDILQVGVTNGKLTHEQEKAHFATWAMLAAPLLAGNDLRTMTEERRQILTNTDLLAIDQDPLGHGASRISQNAGSDGRPAAEVWARPLANGDVAVLLLNRGNVPISIGTTSDAVGLPRALAYSAKDVWNGTTTQLGRQITAEVPATAAKVFRISARDANRVPPLTTASVTGRPLPDTTVVAVGAGDSVELTSTVTNSGRQGITDVRARLELPDGWAATALTSSSATILRGGDSMTTRWKVQAPAAQQPGDLAIGVAAEYRWHEQILRSAPSSTTVTIAEPPAAGVSRLEHLPRVFGQTGWGSLGIDSDYQAKPLVVDGIVHPHGFWAHATSTLAWYAPDCSRLTAGFGLADTAGAGRGEVRFTVHADGSEIFSSAQLHGGDPLGVVDVALPPGTKSVALIADGGSDVNYDHAVWTAPQLTCG